MLAVVRQEKFLIPNKDGHMLAGVLDDVGSGRLAVLCHGFRSNKVARKKTQMQNSCFYDNMQMGEHICIFFGMFLNASLHLLCLI